MGAHRLGLLLGSKVVMYYNLDYFASGEWGIHFEGGRALVSPLPDARPTGPLIKILFLRFVHEPVRLNLGDFF